MALDRRFFLKALGTVGMASAVKLSPASHQILKNEGVFQFLAPSYLQHFNAETITIHTVVNRPSLAWVEILDANGQIGQKLYQTEDGMRNANAEVFKFIIPHRGQDFQYRIVAQEITRFDPYKIEYGETIRTAPMRTKLPFKGKNEEAHILILNDIHENPKSYEVLYQKSSLPSKDLVFLNGDTFHHVVKQEDLTQKLLAPVSHLFAAQTPFVMVRGNHETRGAFARNFKKYFDFPAHKYYQAFTLGDTFWIVLDGGEDKPDSHEVYANTVDYDAYRLEQRDWLQKVLASKERKRAQRTVVVTHIPFFHSDDWHGTLHNRECFHDLLQQAKVTAVISGHTHQHGFYPPDQDHNYYVVIGGGPKEGQRTFVEVTSSKDKFRLTLKLESGEVIGQI